MKLVYAQLSVCSILNLVPSILKNLHEDAIQKLELSI